MSECRVCYKENANLMQPCSRCGFLQPAIIGDANAAEAFVERKARNHRINFLKGFDFGVTVYYWKDQDGMIALDRKERRSFGLGSDMLDNTIWMDQKFARIPDEQQMQVELSVLENGAERLAIPVAVPVPAGAHLQEIGIEVSSDMVAMLKLRNPEGQTASAPVLFLGE